MKAETMILAAVLMAAADEAQKNEHPLENYVLTEEMIDKAIEEGRENKGGMMGLPVPLDSVVDTALKKWQSFPLTKSQPEGNRDRSTGFSLAIYTPYSWVSQQASWAAKRYKSFTREDVTEEMVGSVLRVFAYPDMPTVAPEINRAKTSGVDNIIIRSTAKKNFEVLRPLAIEEGWEYAYTLAGAEVAYASKSAIFDLERVAQITKLDEKGEFFVVVIGTKYNHDFKIKTRHFEKLP